MALARCEKCGRPNGKASLYVFSVEPVPGNPILCSAKRCEQPARIWLSIAEQKQYLNGQTIFILARSTTKVRVLPRETRVHARPLVTAFM